MTTELYQQILEFSYDSTPTRYVDCDISVYESELDFEYDLVFTSGEYPMFEGPYVVEPTQYDQILATKHKAMSDDVTVKEVPTWLVSNEKGYSFIILN